MKEALEIRLKMTSMINQSIYGTLKPRLFWVSFTIALHLFLFFATLISRYCTEVIIHLVLPAESGPSKGSSSPGFTGRLGWYFLGIGQVLANIFYFLTWQWYLYLYNFFLVLRVGLSGLRITWSPWDPKFVGSNLAEVDGFFQDVKILRTSPLGGTLSWGSQVWDFRLIKEP